MGPRAKAGHAQIFLTTVSSLAFLLGLGWVLPNVVEAQARGRTFQIGQTESRTERIRQQREGLERQQKEQEQLLRQISEKNEELLKQQTQVQKTIPLVEQELKRPLSPADYTAKKCELQELTEKQQQIAEQFKANQEERARIEQNRARIQEQLDRMQQQPATVRERPVPPPRPAAQRVPRRPPQEPVWEQAWQQQAALAWQQQAQAQAEARRVPDRLTQIMYSQANPLTGIPSDLLQARQLTCSTQPPFATLRVSGPVTYVAMDADLFFEIPIGAQLTAAEANSARRILVTFTVSGDTLDQGFRFGLKGSPPVTRYFSGSPTFPAGPAANGVHTFLLTPGQFTTSVTDFVLGFSNTPAIGTRITVSQMRVDFYR